MGLRVTVNHELAPISSQLLRLSKATEQLYYTLLYTGKPAYKNKGEAWRKWHAIGFHMAVKSPPPATADSDKIKVSLRSDGKAQEITVENGDRAVVAKLETLIRDLDTARKGLAGKDDASKAETMLANQAIAEQVVKPLMDALKSNALRDDEIEAYMNMLRRGLLAFSHDLVTTIQISSN